MILRSSAGLICRAKAAALRATRVPAAERLARTWMRQLAQDVKPPGERTRKTMPLLLSGAGMTRLLLSSSACATPPKKQISMGFWSMKNSSGLIRDLLTP